MKLLSFLPEPKPIRRVRRRFFDFFWRRKEGVIVGAADNDPAGIVTYSQVGATTGFSLVWLLVLSTPLLIAVEEMSARVAIVTKKGFGRLIADHYGRWIALFAVSILALANIATLGANLAAMGDIFSIFLKMENVRYLFTLLVGLIVLLLLLRKGFGAVTRYLFLLTPVFLMYFLSALLVNAPWTKVITEGLIPKLQFNFDYWVLAVGLLGTTISPYLIFWESTQQVEEERKVEDLKREQSGVSWGMIFSNLAALFIIVVSATVLYGKVEEIESARQAALALKPLAGPLAFLLFSLGILGAGFLSSPIFAASTAYAFSDILHIKEGLDEKQWRAKGFYALILFSMIAALILATLKINPIQLLVYSQVLNGLLVLPLVLILLILANDSHLMGAHRNNWKKNFWGGFALLTLLLADFFMLRQWIVGS